MADVQRLVRQWLETDAAFGVLDVPLVPARRQTVAVAAPETPARFPSAAVRRPLPPPPAPEMQDAVAKRKPVLEMPAAPSGKIADLPALTRQQKQSALVKLLAEVESESRPYLNEISTRVVFGEGDPDAEILFIGEGPGIEEDKTGRPFVGRSGQLLDKMIGAMGFKREAGIEGTGGIFIANIVKLRCADPDEATGRLKDRPPTPEEAARGLPILHRQIEIIRPRAIVTLGAPAIKWLTGTTEGVMKIRGTWFEHRGIPVMPTYHPAFVLRAYTEENRRKVWSDLQAVMTKIGRGK
jgi:uracil-DNA glycosylase family 4